MSCNHIPNIIELDSYNGDYQKYEDAVYKVFEDTFADKQYYFRGKRIAHKKIPIFKDKSGTFWHIVSSGEIEDERIPDFRRYERIAWPGYILDYCSENCDKILVWENNRKGKKRILLWCKEIDYIVILDSRTDFYIFWTAYPINQGHTKRKLQKEYDEYIKAKNA